MAVIKGCRIGPIVAQESLLFKMLPAQKQSFPRIIPKLRENNDQTRINLPDSGQCLTFQ